MIDYIQRNPGYVNQALRTSGSNYQLPVSMTTAGDIRQSAAQRRSGNPSGSISLGGIANAVAGAMSSGDKGDGGGDGYGNTQGMGLQDNPYGDDSIPQNPYGDSAARDSSMREAVQGISKSYGGSSSSGSGGALSAGGKEGGLLGNGGVVKIIGAIL